MKPVAAVLELVKLGLGEEQVDVLACSLAERWPTGCDGVVLVTVGPHMADRDVGKTLRVVHEVADVRSVDVEPTAVGGWRVAAQVLAP